MKGQGRQFVKTSLLAYAVMAALGAAICHFSHDNLNQLFQLESRDEALDWIVIGLCCGGFLTIVGYLAEDGVPGFKELRAMFQEVFGELSYASVFLLSVASAVGEELLFRGAIQPVLGLALTSVIFGLIHLGPSGQIGVWSLWATCAGILMGWTFEVTGNLWPAVLAHFSVNFLSMVRMVYAARHGKRDQLPQGEESDLRS